MRKELEKVDYIANGNCLDLLKKLPDACIDLVVTSPPYDNLRTYKGYTWEFEKIAMQLFRVMKGGGNRVDSCRCNHSR